MAYEQGTYYRLAPKARDAAKRVRTHILNGGHLFDYPELPKLAYYVDEAVRKRFVFEPFLLGTAARNIANFADINTPLVALNKLAIEGYLEAVQGTSRRSRDNAQILLDSVNIPPPRTPTVDAPGPQEPAERRLGFSVPSASGSGNDDSRGRSPDVPDENDGAELAGGQSSVPPGWEEQTGSGPSDGTSGNASEPPDGSRPTPGDVASEALGPPVERHDAPEVVEPPDEMQPTGERTPGSLEERPEGPPAPAPPASPPTARIPEKERPTLWQRQAEDAIAQGRRIARRRRAKRIAKRLFAVAFVILLIALAGQWGYYRASGLNGGDAIRAVSLDWRYYVDETLRFVAGSDADGLESANLSDSEADGEGAPAGAASGDEDAGTGDHNSTGSAANELEGLALLPTATPTATVIPSETGIEEVLVVGWQATESEWRSSLLNAATEASTEIAEIGTEQPRTWEEHWCLRLDSSSSAAFNVVIVGYGTHGTELSNQSIYLSAGDVGDLGDISDRVAKRFRVWVKGPTPETWTLTLFQWSGSCPDVGAPLAEDTEGSSVEVPLSDEPSTELRVVWASVLSAGRWLPFRGTIETRVDRGGFSHKVAAFQLPPGSYGGLRFSVTWDEMITSRPAATEPFPVFAGATTNLKPTGLEELGASILAPR